MMKAPLTDCIDRPDGQKQFIWGWITVDLETDLLIVAACGCAEATQMNGSRAVHVGKLMLRAMWRRHLQMGGAAIL